jgi:very-short-patch-repair endonuclease
MVVAGVRKQHTPREFALACFCTRAADDAGAVSLSSAQSCIRNTSSWPKWPCLRSSMLVRAPPNRQAIRGKFKQLVADFVLCRSDFSIVAVIELDDPSHAQRHRQDADARKTKAVESAGLTCVRVPAGPIPSETDLRRVIQPHVTVTQAVDAAPTTLRVADPDKEAVRHSVVGLAVIIAIIAAGWVMYSQLWTFSMPSAVAVKSLAAMPRLAGRGHRCRSSDQRRPVLGAIALCAEAHHRRVRCTCSPGRASDSRRTRSRKAREGPSCVSGSTGGGGNGKAQGKGVGCLLRRPGFLRASARVEGPSGLWQPIYSR